MVAVLLAVTANMATAAVYTLTVAGLGGNADFEQRFTADAGEIHSAISAGAQASYLSGEGATRQTILAELQRWSQVMSSEDSAVVILVGHGATGGNEYRFNVVGPDLSGEQLNQALEALPATRQLIVNTSSASGALLETLAEKPGRAVITATKNGRELQATRFSTYFAQALTRPSADLDKDERISAAEAFGFAQSAVADYFDAEGLLATEHPRQHGGDLSALILSRLDAGPHNDIGNAQAPDSVAGPDAGPVSGIPAELLARQQLLNEQIRALRARRDQMDNEDYLTELQTLLVALSRLSEEIEQIEVRGRTP